ncbi:MAG: hypothetical protein IJW67_00715 [Blautia sp.]|nr:hypothetical protein [Blautia sp.]
MNKLWRKLPPPLADSFGFLEMIRQTDGVGLIDDCSGYRLTKERRGGPDTRTVCSEIDSGDAVNGTREKVLDAFRKSFGNRKNTFGLLASGPCAAMIGTDLEEAASVLSEEFHIPVGVAKVTGQKNYDIGLSETMCALARLLCQEQEILPGSVNLIGGNRYDWKEGAVQKLRALLEQKGIPVIACPGGPLTADEIRRMPAAAMNLVLTVSGLDTAKYLQKQFGTPYTTLLNYERVRKEEWMQFLFPEIIQAVFSIQADHILVISEQLTGNSIRWLMQKETETENIKVATLFRLAKEFSEPEDVRLKSEEEIAACMQNGNYQVVIGDPSLRGFAPKETEWVDLPHRAMFQFDETRISDTGF